MRGDNTNFNKAQVSKQQRNHLGSCNPNRDDWLLRNDKQLALPRRKRRREGERHLDVLGMRAKGWFPYCSQRGVKRFWRPFLDRWPCSRTADKQRNSRHPEVALSNPCNNWKRKVNSAKQRNWKFELFEFLFKNMEKRKAYLKSGFNRARQGGPFIIRCQWE